MLRSHLERKDGEGEDDDGGDPCRDDHCVRVVLHTHLVVVNDTQSDSIQYLNFAKK